MLSELFNTKVDLENAIKKCFVSYFNNAYEYDENIGEIIKFFNDKNMVKNWDYYFYYNIVKDLNISSMLYDIIYGINNGNVSETFLNGVLYGIPIENFKEKWNNLYNLFFEQKYDPFTNFKLTNEITKSINGNKMTTSGSRTVGSKEEENTLNEAINSNIKENKNITRTSNNELSKQGFNSNSYNPLDKETNTFTEQQSGDENFSDKLENKETTTNNQIHYDNEIEGSLDTSNTEQITETHTQEGNTGSIYQNLFNKEYEIRKKMYRDIILDDLVSIFFQRVYE